MTTFRTFVHTKSMTHIVSVTNPFEVLNSVVGSILIPMIHLREFLRIRYKSFCNETVNCWSAVLSILRQTDHRVSLTVQSGSKPFSFSHSIYSTVTTPDFPSLRVTPHSSIYRNCIPFSVPFYIFHRFIISFTVYQ